ncbi:MAG: hypothetical protein ACUVYA_11535 [Planctomycetota bacterium]
MARIPGVFELEGRGGRSILDLIVAAFLGACAAFALSYLAGRAAARRSKAERRSRTGAQGLRAPDLPPPCDRAACGLEEFAREVEGRLDAKLDRLEKLLKAADLVLAAQAPGRRDAGGETAAELRGITEEERERVLELAAVGESPESISHAVGLVRGEVDLILKLFGGNRRA